MGQAQAAAIRERVGRAEKPLAFDDLHDALESNQLGLQKASTNIGECFDGYHTAGECRSFPIL